ncbi:unnamed protein product [Sphenostylis stenocarpa]|uniref:U3 small nucleolar RNA-associated protein 10 N-terminal domain-containing protein n=1 Tax=Sphenostylis stenocarpa TaxID=92480 RepID=A0AA86SZE2_9FABA|nr:unnamed protein product [Sphenostylis stenocarpa]
MTTSIASQLEAIRSFVKSDSQPLKRPFTRPSILFEPKEAADIDIETLFSIALEGLEVLIGKDERFRNYKNDLFSQRSKELDRELMGIEQNHQLNVSISAYLKLLSGYFLLRPALKTLEYLIRRYKIHVYNNEDLILCSLPYHDTHPFIRITQILETRNTKWGFLDGVKASGAPPPRMVIVQQCIRDKGILDTLCNYASPSKRSQPSRHVIGFCTAVFVEVLGTVVTVKDDIVKRILPFVVSGLQPGINGVSDHKAGSLMIIGLLGNKAALSPKLLNSLIRSVAEVARGEAIELTDLYWFRLSLITLINLVQSQNVEVLPTKAVDILKEIRDLPGVLLELSKEFNIEKFLRVLLDSLIDCSSDEYCQQTLLSLIEKVPIDSFVYHVVTKILSTCVKLAQKVGDSTSSMSDGNSDSSFDISDSKFWFGLYHPKADVRRATLLELDKSVNLETKLVGSEFNGLENLINIEEAILGLLDDKDLTVVQAALCVAGLPNVVDSSKLLCALQNVLRRCTDKLLSVDYGIDLFVELILFHFFVEGCLVAHFDFYFYQSSADNDNLSVEVAVSCVKNAISYFNDHTDYLKNIASMIFPILIVLPQWETSATADLVLDEFNSEMLKWECKEFLKHLLYANLRPVNVKVMICILWRLQELLLSVAPSDILLCLDDQCISKIRDMFVFFASSKLKNAFRVPGAVQVESLQCYAYLCSLQPDSWITGLLAEFPSILVPLACDNQNTRVAAMNCIDSLYTLWCHFEHSGKKNGKNASWLHFVGELLSLMIQMKTFILSDKKFLPSLFASTLSTSFPNISEPQNILVPQNVDKRFDESTKTRILGFILGSTLKLSNYGKLMILSLFKGIGYTLMHVPEVDSFLFNFLNQYFEELSKSCPKLSDNETQIACLLLESCVMSSPSGGNHLQHLLLKALQFGGLTSDDPASVKPCITVLNKLNSKFFMELENKVKENVFCELVFLWRNGNGDVQCATKEALMRIDISISTVGHMLDLILAQKRFILSSLDENTVKKQKLVGHLEAEYPSNEICTRDDPFCILSSLLDVLLLKKDITNR